MQELLFLIFSFHSPFHLSWFYSWITWSCPGCSPTLTSWFKIHR
jgi:hypothetical protein